MIKKIRPGVQLDQSQKQNVKEKNIIWEKVAIILKYFPASFRIIKASDHLYMYIISTAYICIEH